MWKADKIKYLTRQVENKFAFLIQLAIYKVFGKIFNIDHSIFRWVIPIRANNFKSKYVFQITKQLSKDDKEFYKILNNPKYKVLIDVGSSIGTIADYFLRYDSDRFVYCFEPRKSSVLFSAKYLNCPVFPFALSDYIGGGILYEKGRKYDGKASMNLKFKQSSKISVTKLDEFSFKKVDIIKYDVEGHEFEAIAGSLETIRKHNPDIIFENNTGNIESIKRLLPDYRISIIGKVSGHTGLERNYLACLTK